MKSRRAFSEKCCRNIVLCSFFCLFWACASAPAPKAAAPDENWPRLDPVLPSASAPLAEPAVPPEADPSFPRMDAPGRPVAAASAPPQPEVPELPPEAAAAAEEENAAADIAENAAGPAEEIADAVPPQTPPAASPPLAVLPASRPRAEPEKPDSNASPPAARPLPETEPAGGNVPLSAPAEKPADYFPPSEQVATITTGPLRQMSGIVGTNFTVTLPGIGWIYLPGEESAGKIRYMGKVTERGETVFAFAPFEKGDYNLRFQQQDLAANTLHYDDVNLSVASPEENAAAPPAEAPEAATEPAAPVAQTPPAAPPPVPANETPPTAAPASASAAPPPAAGDEAVPGETELARLQRLGAEGDADALAELEKYTAARETENGGLDELYFFLAQTYEKNTPARDIKKSLLYYEKVRDNFPLSPRWQASDLRSRYIRMNYFDIR